MDEKMNFNDRAIKSSWTLEKLPSVKDGDLIVVPVDEIYDLYTSRSILDDDEQLSLNESVRENGIINPLTVNVIGREVIIIAGRRRLHAAKVAGLKTVPCFVKDKDPEIISLIENLHRKDLTPIQQAEAFSKLKIAKGIKQKELAKILNKSTTNINDILRLNDLPDEIKISCRDSQKYSRRFFLEILKQKSPDKMIEKFIKAQEKSVSKNCERHRDFASKNEAGGIDDKLNEKKSPYKVIEKMVKNLLTTTIKLSAESMSDQELNEIEFLFFELIEALKEKKLEKFRMLNFPIEGVVIV
jgi:ParB family chromosome partitioning protein